MLDQIDRVLDIPTLFFVAVCLAGLLGLFLIFAWLQERNIRALAWWGAAYLIGSSAMALWSAPSPMMAVPPAISGALLFVACSMIWNGVRLFHGRRALPLTNAAGALIWVLLMQVPGIGDSADGRSTVAAVMVALYTFFVAFELGRERRKSRFSRTAKVIVPALHAAIFMLPIAMVTFMPASIAHSWLEVFALETMIYAVGTAFIVLIMVKDHRVHVYRHAATTDYLTDLLNRRAFLDGAGSLCSDLRRHGEPVTVMMFDLDRFKSINDRFGHATGDDALRVFAATVRASMRTGDIIGRLGGEEFAAIVPGNVEIAAKIAERVRASFEKAGVTIGGHNVGATVSIGAACAPASNTDIEQLLARADAALYRAKRDGRNRLCTADDMPADTASDMARLIASARAQSQMLRENTSQRRSATAS